MPDSKGRPQFSDFADVDSVERALETAPDKWRWTLATWEYALLRAERDGTERPSKLDLYHLDRTRAFVHPAMTAFLIGSWVVMGAFALFVILASGPPDDSAVFVLIPVGLFGIICLISLGGSQARAMRLVRASRNCTPSQRREMMNKALAPRHWWS